MKITVEEIAKLFETEIVIKCKELDSSVENIISTLKLFEKTISAKKNGQNYILTTSEMYYFDSVDNKIFCYTVDDVYEVALKLYEIENIFYNTNFIRINKNMILDAGKIKSFKAQLNGRMEAVLMNDEKVEISRNYVAALKIKLGGLIK